ncbi:MAG: hypothetical protein NPIRA03_22650 [Nitrospirales bacterium]|nr:MAG: hypothetical protein NPIRA03_22650 [Nitrospirales bacterium]
MALLIATLPALSYARGYFFYNSIVALLGLGLGLWYLRSPKEWLILWANQLFRWFFIMGTVYWFISLILTGQYHANLRAMEMVFTVSSIYLLAQYPKYLATALAGLGISVFSVAIGMIGQGDRLGMADIDGEHVGNAITFGLPVALVLLLAIADNGKWLFLQNSKIVRNGLIAMCGIFLLLSTSRGSWLVALVGIGVAIFYQSQQRRKIFFALFLMGCVLVGVMQTQSGEKVYEHFEKLFDSERTLVQKSTGRYEMWLLFPEVLKDSPIWGVGPGLGKEAYAHYSWVDREVTYRQGHEVAWHALYLQVGVETGLIGLTVLGIFLIKLIFRTLLYRKMTKQVIPLVGILGFMTIGITVPGIDGISGLFLGLAFLGIMPLQRKMPKKLSRKDPRENSKYIPPL